MRTLQCEGLQPFSLNIIRENGIHGERLRLHGYDSIRSFAACIRALSRCRAEELYSLSTLSSLRGRSLSPQQRDQQMEFA